MDYQNAGHMLRTSLGKFITRRNQILACLSLLYDLDHNFDPTAHLKSGLMIRVQVESVKRRKIERSGSKKRWLPATVNEEMENFVFQVVPPEKKKEKRRNG